MVGVPDARSGEFRADNTLEDCEVLWGVVRKGATKPLTSLHNFISLKRSALEITETELRLMAAPAMTGLSSRPKNG